MKGNTFNMSYLSGIVPCSLVNNINIYIFKAFVTSCYPEAKQTFLMSESWGVKNHLYFSPWNAVQSRSRPGRFVPSGASAGLLIEMSD